MWRRGDENCKPMGKQLLWCTLSVNFVGTYCTSANWTILKRLSLWNERAEVGDGRQSSPLTTTKTETTMTQKMNSIDNIMWHPIRNNMWRSQSTSVWRNAPSFVINNLCWNEEKLASSIWINQLLWWCWNISALNQHRTTSKSKKKRRFFSISSDDRQNCVSLSLLVSSVDAFFNRTLKHQWLKWPVGVSQAKSQLDWPYRTPKQQLIIMPASRKGSKVRLKKTSALE
jgi:hypothetical protein